MTQRLTFAQPLPPITVTGERARLRPWRADDIDCVEAASADPNITSITSVPAIFTPEEGAAFIERQGQRLSSGEGWALAITDASTGVAVGHIGLWTAHASKGRADIGYWVVPAGRGNGFATDAVRALTGWAYEHADLHRLQLEIEPWNTASKRVATAAGYEYEATLRSFLRRGDEMRDVELFTRVRPS